jgi:hypothetical protein
MRDPLLSPPSTLAEIFRHPCLQSGLRPSKRSESAFSPFFGKNRVILGGRGGPRNIFFIGILLSLLLRSPCKNLEPYDNPFWGFSNGGNKKKNKKKKKNMQNSGLRLSDTVCTATLGPIYLMLYSYHTQVPSHSRDRVEVGTPRRHLCR